MNDQKLEKILIYNYEQVLKAYMDAYGNTHGVDTEKNFRIDGNLDKTYIPSRDKEIPEILIKNHDSAITIIVSLESKNFYQMCSFDKMSFNFKIEEMTSNEGDKFNIEMNDKYNKLSFEMNINQVTKPIMNFLSTLLMSILLNVNKLSFLKK